MDYLNNNVIRILSILVEGRAYFNEIYEKTGIKSKNNLVKNLNLLTKNTILIKESNKSNTFYSLNYKNKITLALLNLINKNKFESLPFIVKKGIGESIFNFKPRVVILFGSYAKGDSNNQSDVDLIFFDAVTKKGVKDMANKYGLKLNIVFMGLNELKKPDDALKHIIKTGYLLVGEEYFYNECETI